MNTLENVRKPVHSKCFGIEIECKMLETQRRIHGKYHGMFYAGEDGSINVSWTGPEIGVEWVSQPLPYSWLRKEIAKLGKKFTWSHDSSCGIHVHVSRQCISKKRVIKLLNYFCQLKWEQQRTLFGREFNSYCNPTRVQERHCAINTTGSETVEFRMFSSGDWKWAQECLRRTKLMCEFKGTPTFDNLLELFTNPEKE